MADSKKKTAKKAASKKAASKKKVVRKTPAAKKVASKKVDAKKPDAKKPKAKKSLGKKARRSRVDKVVANLQPAMAGMGAEKKALLVRALRDELGTLVKSLSA